MLNRRQCFVGNYTAAFRHLRSAQSYLDEATPSLVPNSEPLSTCITELGLLVQIILPLPLVKLSPLKTSGLDPTTRSMDSPRGSAHELQQLLSLICAHQKINVVVWASLCYTEDTLSHQTLAEFQSSLLRWKAQSLNTFRDYHETPGYFESTESLSKLPIPPKAQSFASTDAALAASIFHCYMGRTMCLMSMATGGDEACEHSAVLHAYHNLCIVQGIEQEKKERGFNERRYFPCNAVKIGFIPLLFLGSQFCYDSTWLQFTIDKLMSIGQEGPHNGEILANALQSLSLFQAHAQKIRGLEPVDETQKAGHSVHSLRFNVITILIPSPEEKKAVAYYVRALRFNLRDIPLDRSKVVQIVGRARWEDTALNASTSVTMEFFGPDHSMNQGLRERCVYLQLASHEPIAQEWETILGTEALGHHGYFVHLAALRESAAQEMATRLEHVAGLDLS
jgi:hypothetical protein